jgi:hypothetical protein
MCFWECPRDTAFPYQNKAHPFTQKKPFNEFNSIPKMSLLQSFPSPNLLSLSLSQTCLFKNTHLETTCSCKKLHFIVVGKLIADDHQIANKNNNNNTTATIIPPSSILLDPKSAGLWATTYNLGL